MSKHTPGPWFANLKYGNYAVYSQQLIDDDDGDGWEPCICELDSDEPVNHEANARLIAAAPELLTALQDIANYTPEKYTDPTTALQILRENANIARAAIAKATGVTQ
jgi:hypothetical protein